MDSWRIRRATPADADSLADLARHTYRETFTHYPPADLDRFLAERYNAEVFSACLNDPADTLWLVEENGQLIAYAQAGSQSKLPISPPLLPAAELRRLYVLKAAHGRGIGTALMAEVLANVQEAAALLLGVWSGNRKAQAFYAQYGFIKIGEYAYPPIGDIVDCEWIMMKSL